MKKTIILCDKCKKEIEETDIMQIGEMDFCHACTSDLFFIIQNWVKSEKEESVVKPANVEEDFLTEEKYPAKKKKKAEDTEHEEEPKKKIDWDKACALKKAGWSNREIAEECKIKLSTLSVEIYRHLKLYEARLAEEQRQKKSEASNPWA